MSFEGETQPKIATPRGRERKESAARTRDKGQTRRKEDSTKTAAPAHKGARRRGGSAGGGVEMRRRV